LKERVVGLGSIGELKKVSAGFARNYLIPRGLAAVANAKEVAQVEHQKRALKKKLAKLKSDMDAIQKQIEGTPIVIRRKAGESGKLFGSITHQDIAEALAEKGVNVDKRSIEVEGSLKKLGTFKVPVRLMEGIVAEVNLSVVADVE
ncbi:MAG: 50S ribosomal protein L9, partial [Bdellovibrionales bacterium]|nr:50S ribosomal protein L9 [Bdellovibrionales bacterium]